MTVFIYSLKRMIIQPVNWVFVMLFPLIFAFLIGVSTDNSETEYKDSDFYFGVADQDGTPLSRTLVARLEERYNIRDIAEANITAALTDSEVPWVLLIREGYGLDVSSGRAPALEGYCLSISDVSALGGVTAENVTRALMLLGSGDAETLAAWSEASRVDVIFAEGDNWESVTFWMGFFGFISLFTAYFIIKTLLDDKRGGMPDRLNVLPRKPITVMVQGTLAAFLVTEITVIMLFASLWIQLGTIPNAPYLLLLLSVYNLFSVGLVLAIVSIARELGAASVAMTMLATVFAMLGGLFWPLHLAPEFMRRLAWFSPGYWLARGLVNIREITFEGFGMPMLFLVGFVAATILLGGWKNIQPLEE